ncbi:MAG: hypothetical protein WCG01_01390 [bacterium]
MNRIILYGFLIFQLLNSAIVMAADPSSRVDVGQGNKSAPIGTVRLVNPIKASTPQALIGDIIQGALGIVGSLTLLMFVYGGFLWLTSAGNAKAVDKGKSILLWSTIGLAIIFSSYALVKFTIQSIGG